MAKFRNFSIVLHDVQKSDVSKNEIFDWLLRLFGVPKDVRQHKSLKHMVVAEEAYNHQDGSHIHVFFELKTQRAFNKTLNDFQLKWPHGRVQVDKGRGKIYQQCAYLIDPTVKVPTKDKHTDPSPLFWPTPEIVYAPGQRGLEALISIQGTQLKLSNIPLPQNSASAFIQDLRSLSKN